MERLCEENETERQGVEMIGGDSSVWTIKGTKMRKKTRPSFDAIHPLDIQGNKKRTNLINSVCILQARALKVSPQQPTGAGPVPSPPAKQKVAATDAKAAQQTDEILNSILPPRYGSLTSNSHLKCVYLYNMLFAYKCLV